MSQDEKPVDPKDIMPYDNIYVPDLDQLYVPEAYPYKETNGGRDPDIESSWD